MNWTYFRENGPDSPKYNQEKEREKYKKWFEDHQTVFDSTKLFEFWSDDNKQLVDEFKEKFKICYNSIANRMFSIKIED